MKSAKTIATEHARMLRLLQRLRSLKWEACEGWPDDAEMTLREIEASQPAPTTKAGEG
jgi:hypothetical protein